MDMEGRRQARMTEGSEKREVSEETVNAMVVDYLKCNCYMESLDKFKELLGTRDSVEDATVLGRKSVMELINEGSLMEAIKEIKRGFSFICEGSASLETSLYCQYFIECIRRNEYEAALQVAQERFRNKTIGPPYEEIFSLLAYRDPHQNTLLSKYMDLARRKELSLAVDSAIKGKLARAN